MLNGKSHQPRRKLLDEHENNQRNGEPADELSEPLRRNVRHEPPSADDAGERGWKHPQDEASPGVLAVGVDSKDIRKDQHRKNRPRGLSGRKDASHHEDREHSQSAETSLCHADANGGQSG